MLLLIAPFYVVAWIVCVCVMRPQDPFEGVVALFLGAVWPALLIGWIVSRPYATAPHGVWAGNTRPMLRLVCRMADRPRMLDALTQAFAESNNWEDLPTVRSIAVWPYERRNGWFEALVYAAAVTAGERDLGCKCYERFAAIIDPRAPDPYYFCGAAYCDDPACTTHNRRHPNHDE